MKKIRYTYLLLGIGFLGFAGVLFFSLIADAVSDFRENGMTKTVDGEGQAIMTMFDLSFLYVYFLIFGIPVLIGIYLLIEFVRNSILDRRNNRIKHFGRNATGTYLKHEENKKIKDSYEIYFSFKNGAGKIIETKTNGAVFSLRKAEALAAMKTFSVRYMDDNAVIMADNI